MLKIKWPYKPFKTVLNKYKEYRVLKKIPYYDRTIEQHKKRYKQIKYWELTLAVNNTFVVIAFLGAFFYSKDWGEVIFLICGLILFYIAIFDCEREKEAISNLILQNEQLKLIVKNNIKILELGKNENGLYDNRN